LASRVIFARDRRRALRLRIANIYACPGGAELTSTGNIDQGHIVYYRAGKSDCSRCLLNLNEDVRDRVGALADTEALQQSRRKRRKVEMRFAHMKRILGLDRFRLRA